MLNNVILVGRITKMEEKENKTILDLKVGRNYKNADGIYEDDLIRCIVWYPMADRTKEYINIGDIIGIKGRLQNIENEIYVVAERVTLLTTTNKKEGVENGGEEN